MTTYTKSTSGGVDVGGCPSVSVEYNIPSNFEVGDVAYSKAKAIKGKTERVGIKKVVPTNLNDSIIDGGLVRDRLYINYIDIFNGIWMESELVTKAEATELIESYQDSVVDRRSNGSTCVD